MYLISPEGRKGLSEKLAGLVLWNRLDPVEAISNRNLGASALVGDSFDFGERSHVVGEANLPGFEEEIHTRNECIAEMVPEIQTDLKCHFLIQVSVQVHTKSRAIYSLAVATLTLIHTLNNQVVVVSKLNKCVGMYHFSILQPDITRVIKRGRPKIVIWAVKVVNTSSDIELGAFPGRLQAQIEPGTEVEILQALALKELVFVRRGLRVVYAVIPLSIEISFSVPKDRWPKAGVAPTVRKPNFVTGNVTDTGRPTCMEVRLRLPCLS